MPATTPSHNGSRVLLRMTTTARYGNGRKGTALPRTEMTLTPGYPYWRANPARSFTTTLKTIFSPKTNQLSNPGVPPYRLSKTIDPLPPTAFHDLYKK